MLSVADGPTKSVRFKGHSYLVISVQVAMSLMIISSKKKLKRKEGKGGKKTKKKGGMIVHCIKS
ncbi:hypothetical protein I7I53_03862 [Histoplasma capsulatum var. duboisii H88]|uniref:Uncharacterized protein n=1 Tax=Ajellomyces capsulatus (strain H88) TaxID=544711 RepID=A0A8A1LRU7_AJEC8|nr:hypothetical protein I7I53_03862 [Histoplasma capsulatum var. duboisii H88]